MAFLSAAPNARKGSTTVAGGARRAPRGLVGLGQALQLWSPAGSAGLPAVARSAKEGSLLCALRDLL